MTSAPPPPEPTDEGPQPAASFPSYSSYSAPEGSMPVYPQGGTEPTVAAVPQPRSIQNAVRLMWAGAALSLLQLLVGLLTLGSVKDNIADQLRDDGTFTQDKVDTAYNVIVINTVVVTLLAIALWLGMAKANGDGRKWARVVATALGVLNVLVVITAVAQGQADPLSLVLSVIVAVLAITILVLLWRKESTDFYNSKSRRP